MTGGLSSSRRFILRFLCPDYVDSWSKNDFANDGILRMTDSGSRLSSIHACSTQRFGVERVALKSLSQSAISASRKFQRVVGIVYGTLQLGPDKSYARSFQLEHQLRKLPQFRR